MTKYTKEDYDFIFANWVDNPSLCVEKTGHSEASIKMTLKGMVKRLNGDIHNGFVRSDKDAQILVEYLENNPRFGKPMTLDYFELKFL